MNLPRWAAVLLLFALVPAPGRSCAAGQCPWMPAAGTTDCRRVASPAPDCCKVKAAPQPFQAAGRLAAPPPAPVPTDAVAIPAAAVAYRTPATTPARPRRAGPPLYTLLAVLLI